MSRRGENIYKRKDGRWEGRYMKGKINNKVKYGYVYGKTYKEVKKSLLLYKVEYANYKTNLKSNPKYFNQLTEEWLMLKEKSISKSTYSSYAYKLNGYILPVLGELFLHEIDSKKLENVIQKWIENGISSSSIKIIFQIIKQCLEYAVTANYIEVNYALDVTLPKDNKQKVQALSLKEQKKLEEICYIENSVYSLAIIFALHTGLRIGELTALTWDDIKFDENIFYVKNTLQRISNSGVNKKTVVSLSIPKTDSSIRVIPLNLKMKKILQELKKRSHSDFIFSNSSSFCEPRLLTYHFHQIRNKAKLPNIHFHQLRHTFATRCIEAQADIVSVSEMLGHTSVKMTLDIYANSFIENRRTTLEQMEFILEN